VIQLLLFDRKRFSFYPITGLFTREVNSLSESIFSIHLYEPPPQKHCATSNRERIKELDKILPEPKPSSRRLVGSGKFGMRVGKIIHRYCVAKHFLLLITDNSLSYRGPREKIEAEAHLYRMYVIRTSICAEVLDDSETVKAFKSLSQIEQEFL
jgi:hypothetical protein